MEDLVGPCLQWGLRRFVGLDQYFCFVLRKGVPAQQALAVLDLLL